LAAAIDRFADAEDAEGALSIAGAIWRFWYGRGRFVEGIAALRRALAVPGTASPLRRANALNGAGALLSAVGETNAALAAYEEAIPRWMACGDRRGLASTLSNRALLLLERARYPEAAAEFEKAVVLLAAIGDEWRAAGVRDNIGLALLSTGD